MNGEKADAYKDRMGSSGTRAHFRALKRRSLDNLSYGGYTEYRKRALPADGWPLSHVIEVIAELWEGDGGHFFFACRNRPMMPMTTRQN